jgi:hypothetical protein
MADRTTDAFTSDDVWTPVSPRLITARRITLALVMLLAVAGVVALFLIPGVPRAWALAAAVSGTGRLRLALVADRQAGEVLRLQRAR